MDRQTLVISALAAAAFAGSAHAGPVSVTNASYLNYTQSFDSLTSTGTNAATAPWVQSTTLEGWVLQSTITSYSTYSVAGTLGGLTTVAALNSVPASNGAANTSATTAFYSLGSTGSSDRALGGRTLYTNSQAGASVGSMGSNLGLKNDTSATISSVNVRYDGEQWGVGAAILGGRRADSIQLYYGFGNLTAVNSISWQAAGTSFNFNAPQLTGSASTLNGNAAANRVADIGGTLTLNWAPGTTLWLRWLDVWSGDRIASGDPVLAIDNVRVGFGTAPVAVVPEASAIGMVLAGLGTLAVAGLRRRRQG
jgi:hypothetical protein